MTRDLSCTATLLWAGGDCSPRNGEFRIKPLAGLPALDLAFREAEDLLE